MHDLDCLAVVEELWDFTDGELSPKREAAFRRHLATCSGCADHLAYYRALLATLRSTPMDPDAVARLRRRVAAVLRTETRRDESGEGTNG